MKIIEKNGLTEIHADEGLTLTNGEVYTKQIYLGSVDRAENWREISDEDAQALIAEAENFTEEVEK